MYERIHNHLSPMADSVLLHDDPDAQEMRRLVRRLGEHAAVLDFEEHLLIPSVRDTMRLWKAGGGLLGFAYIDDFCNLWFETDPQPALSPAELDALQIELISWGAACLRRRNQNSGSRDPLDCSCPADHADRINLLLRCGFTPQQIRILRYSLSLQNPLPAFPLPPGFTIRPVAGFSELDELVDLHRRAFGTDHMTRDLRLAIMNAPGYLPELDLIAVSSGSELAGFCVCGLDEADPTIGSTDPIGVRPPFQRIGLAKALLSHGLRLLKERGALSAELGTSSENLPMQKLAFSLGFRLISERCWFSKEITAVDEVGGWK